ncbi:competence protein TfoX [Pseudolabrys taiwanensis]|uniref:Competence protein TfoX n=2 Tax=Pseudolabrys taiwanensis TaxID=331696 RepID=A0A346A413_9HYPH|nr:competence protein TfoX [Pseudolabrys taiwanensis]
MFGGAGLWADDVMFALITRDVIYLKADDESIAAFEAEACTPFSYTTKNGRHTLTSYWRLPERLYDDPEELAVWARRALGVARAKAVGKKAAGKKAGGQARSAAKAGVNSKRAKTTKTAAKKAARSAAKKTTRKAAKKTTRKAAERTATANVGQKKFDRIALGCERRTILP